MNPAQSLYEFTLNLLNDPSARTAFGDDPQGTLDGAGLGDVSGADLHDILPLVLDFAPVGNLGGENGLNLDSITGQASAVEQLKALTQNLSLGDTTSENNVLGAVSGMTALTQNITDPFSAAGDLTSGIDHIGGGQADPVTTVTGVVGDVTGHVTGGDVTGALDAGNLTSGVQDLSGLTSTVGNAQGVGSTIGDLTGNLGVNTGLEHTVGDIAAHGVGDVTNHLGDISHNGTLGDVTSHVGDIASGSGNVSDVHDVVGNIGDGALSGNIGADLSHLSVGSGNDFHLPH